MPDIFVSKNRSKTVPEPKTSKGNIAKVKKDVESTTGKMQNRLGSFYVFPDKVGFETLEEGEKIILLLRAHPITNLKWISVSALMAVLPWTVNFLGVFNTFPAGLSLVTFLAWYLVLMAYALEGFLRWYFNVYIVTDQRIVDVDFHNLIYKQVSDANITNIQDVTYNMGGVIRTVFNYGDVFVQTAAEVSEFDFLAVPNPDRVVKIIQDLID